jgi:hypothetical protein
LLILEERGKDLKVPYHASAVAARDGNLPHVTATCYTWWQYALYSNYLPLFPTVIYSLVIEIRNIALLSIAILSNLNIKAYLKAGLGGFC